MGKRWLEKRLPKLSVYVPSPAQVLGSIAKEVSNGATNVSKAVEVTARDLAKVPTTVSKALDQAGRDIGDELQRGTEKIGEISAPASNAITQHVAKPAEAFIRHTVETVVQVIGKAPVNLVLEVAKATGDRPTAEKMRAAREAVGHEATKIGKGFQEGLSRQFQAKNQARQMATSVGVAVGVATGNPLIGAAVAAVAEKAVERAQGEKVKGVDIVERAVVNAVGALYGPVGAEAAQIALEISKGKDVTPEDVAKRLAAAKASEIIQGKMDNKIAAAPIENAAKQLIVDGKVDLQKLADATGSATANELIAKVKEEVNAMCDQAVNPDASSEYQAEDSADTQVKDEDNAQVVPKLESENSQQQEGGKEPSELDKKKSQDQGQEQHKAGRRETPAVMEKSGAKSERVPPVQLPELGSGRLESSPLTDVLMFAPLLLGGSAAAAISLATRVVSMVGRIARRHETDPKSWGRNLPDGGLSKTEYARYMEKPHVENSELKTIMDKAYRERAEIGLGGSTAQAIRFTRETGQPVKGSDHVQKGKELVTKLESWLKKQEKVKDDFASGKSQNVPASTHDAQQARNVIQDLKDALATPKANVPSTSARSTNGPTPNTSPIERLN